MTNADDSSETLQYRAPAEESPHVRTWMCWPSTPSIYGGAGAYYDDVQATLARLATAIARFEPVSLLADASLHSKIAKLCGPGVDLVDVPTDDMWARDSGPVFVKDDARGVAAVDLNFNAWGNHQAHELDARVASEIARHAGAPVLSSVVTGEGGGIEFDGEGTLLLTDSCWVNDNRNPGKSREAIGAELAQLFGIEKTIWLPGVRGEEETDGHIDGSIRFIRPGVVMMSGYPGDDTIWGEVYEESKAILSRETDAKGRPFEIFELSWATNARSKHPNMFTSYANFYVANGVVVSPAFGDRKADARARDTLAMLYPEREIVMLDFDRIYENGGGVHCVTQQQPA